MVATITSRITLTGAEAIKSDLRGIADEGKAAFDKLQAAAAANATFKNLGTSLRDAVGRLKEFGSATVEGSQRALEFAKNVTDTIAKLALFSGGLAEGGKKLLEFFKNVGETNEQLNNLARTAGTSTEQIKGLQFAFAQSGVEPDKLGNSLARLSRALTGGAESSKKMYDEQQNLLKANREGTVAGSELAQKFRLLQENADPVIKIFDRYNVSLQKNADGTIDVTNAFKQLADGFSKSDNATRKANDAMTIFGRAGAELIPVLNQGAAGIERFINEAQRIAPALTREQSEAVERMDAAFKTFTFSIQGLKQSVGAVFAPLVGHGITAVTDFLTNNRARVLELALAFKEQLSPQVDRFVAFLNSPDSNGLIDQLVTKAVSLGEAFQSALNNIVIPAFHAWHAVLQTVADAINNIFGTNLTAGALSVLLVVGRLTGFFGLLASGVKLAVSAFRILFTGLRVLIPVIQALGIALVIPEIALAALGLAIGALVVLGAQKLGGFQEIVKRVFDGFYIILTTPFKLFADFLVAFWNGLPTGQQAIAVVKAAFDAVLAAIQNAFTGLVGFLSSIWESVSAGAVQAVSAIVQFFSDGVTAIVKFFTDFPANLVTVWNALMQGASDALNAVVKFFTDGFNNLSTFVSGVVTNIVNFFVQGFDGLKSYFSSWYDAVAGFFSNLLQKAQAVAQAVASAGGGGGGGSGVQSNAEGGHIRGRGTGTSDSILSWLSNGEFVMRARAVQKYGVGFMSAVNKGTLSLKALQGFSIGGMVHAMASPAIPRFATGGLVAALQDAGGGRPFTLQIGDESFTGLRASQSAIDGMSRYASGKAVRSAGRKPLWFQG